MIHIKYKFNILNLLMTFSLCIFTILPFSLFGAINNEMFEKANTALEQKDFATALEMFKILEQQGYGDEGMFRNMAYAALNLNAEADAILYLEKTLKYNPNNELILKHLSQIRAANNLDDPNEHELKMAAFARKITGMMSLQFVIIIQVFILGLLGWIIYKQYPFDKISQKASYQISGVFMLLLLTFLIGNYKHSSIYNNKGIIITKENTAIYLSPDTLSPQTSKLPLGTKISFKDHLKGWWQIETIYGETGWIQSSKGIKI